MWFPNAIAILLLTFFLITTTNSRVTKTKLIYDLPKNFILSIGEPNDDGKFDSKAFNPIVVQPYGISRTESADFPFYATKASAGTVFSLKHKKLIAENVEASLLPFSFATLAGLSNIVWRTDVVYTKPVNVTAVEERDD